MIDITDEITRLWGKIIGKTPNLWQKIENISLGDIQKLAEEPYTVRDFLSNANLSAIDSYDNLLVFRRNYIQSYSPGSNPEDVFEDAYLTNQFNALQNAVTVVNQLFDATSVTVIPTDQSLGFLKSLNVANLRICDDESNWHQYSDYPFSIVQSMKNQWGYPSVLQHNTGPVAIIDVNGTITDVLDPNAFSSPVGTKTLSDIPVLPHDPVPTDGDYIEHTNEYTILWIICQLYAAKAVLDTLYNTNVYMYNQKNPSNPLTYVPPPISQDKNDQYPPPQDTVPIPVVTDNPPLPQPSTPSDEYKLTTELTPETTTSDGKESTTMNWLVPVLAGLVGAAAVGGAIWYSVKKEEQYGLIGPKGVRQAAEPTKVLYVWTISLHVISPSRQNLKHQLQYTIQANNEQEAIEKAEKISRSDGNKVIGVVYVVKGRTVHKSTVAEPAVKMPKEVKEVVNAMQDNAVKADQLEDSVYAARNIEHNDEVWVIGDNYERISLNLVYKNGIWYYRDSHAEGSDRPMKNGFREALANANIFYTG